MYAKYNSMMHRGVESAKPGKALRMSTKANWTASAGGQAAGTDSPGKARRRRTMSNRGEGTGLASKGSGRVRIPRTRHGFYPLHGEKY